MTNLFRKKSFSCAGFRESATEETGKSNPKREVRTQFHRHGSTCWFPHSPLPHYHQTTRFPLSCAFPCAGVSLGVLTIGPTYTHMHTHGEKRLAAVLCKRRGLSFPFPKVGGGSRRRPRGSRGAVEGRLRGG